MTAPVPIILFLVLAGVLLIVLKIGFSRRKRSLTQLEISLIPVDAAALTASPARPSEMKRSPNDKIAEPHPTAHSEYEEAAALAAKVVAISPHLEPRAGRSTHHAEASSHTALRRHGWGFWLV